MKMTRLLPTLLCLALLTGGLAACSDSDSDPATPPGDETAPQIIATSPVRLSGGNSVHDDIAVHFSEPMDPASADGNVTLTGGTLTGTTWESDRVLLIEHEAFDMETDINVNVGTGLADAAGNNLAEVYAFWFLTESTNLIVMGVSPGNTETGVAINTGITLRFSDYVYMPEIIVWVFLSDDIVTEGDKANFTFLPEHLGNNTYLLTPDGDLPTETRISPTTVKSF